MTRLTWVRAGFLADLTTASSDASWSSICFFATTDKKPQSRLFNRTQNRVESTVGLVVVEFGAREA